MENRTTPKDIKKLEKNTVFVFGSNADGAHNGGAAKYAHENFGAAMGIARGRTGDCYAIDTMSGIEIIKEQMQPFIEAAKILPLMTFLVTEIGCGIAGYEAKDIAPLFESARDIENIHLPESFWAILYEPKVIKAWKAFDKDFKCRNFQYEVGKGYEHDGEVESCSSGFHACEYPMDVFNYYDITNCKLAEVELSGEIHKDNSDSKIAAKNIRIKAEVTLGVFIKASVDFIFGSWFEKATKDNQNASSGYNSTNASSGNNSTNASSGNNSKNASSGNYSKNASSGYDSTNASSGYNSTNASSGYNSKNASSGYNSTNASSGYNSTNASSGYNSKNASSGYNSKNASSGYNSTNASSGNNSTNASSGYNSKNASSGNYSTNASSGYNSTNASSGYNSKNASSGNNSTIEMTGANNVGSAIGNNSKIKGINGSLICLVNYDDKGIALNFVTGKIGEEGLEEDTWYEVRDGKFSKCN